MENQIKQLAFGNIVVSVLSILLSIFYLIGYGFLSFIAISYALNPQLKNTNNAGAAAIVYIAICVLALVDGIVAIVKIFSGIKVNSLKESGRKWMMGACIADIGSRTIALMLIIYANYQLKTYTPSIMLVISIGSLILSATTQQKLRSTEGKTVFLYAANRIVHRS